MENTTVIYSPNPKLVLQICWFRTWNPHWFKHSDIKGKSWPLFKIWKCYKRCSFPPVEKDSSCLQRRHLPASVNDSGPLCSSATDLFLEFTPRSQEGTEFSVLLHWVTEGWGLCRVQHTAVPCTALHRVWLFCITWADNHNTPQCLQRWEFTDAPGYEKKGLFQVSIPLLFHRNN